MLTQYKNAIDRMSLDEIVEVHEFLNGWYWNDKLGPEPKGWDKMTRRQKYTFTAPTMGYLKTYLTDKAYSRYHCTSNLGMTIEQFIEWWADHKCSVYKPAIESDDRGRDYKMPFLIPLVISLIGLVSSICSILVLLFRLPHQ